MGPNTGISLVPLFVMGMGKWGGRVMRVTMVGCVFVVLVILILSPRYLNVHCINVFQGTSIIELHR